MAQDKRYLLPVNGHLVEVSENVYRAFYKSRNREKYIEKVESDIVYSYNALDTETSTGESLMADMKDVDPEDIALANELSDQLHRCLTYLPRAERELIQALYFDGMTEKDYSIKANLTQSGVSRKRDKILAKLRVLMKNM